MVIRAHSDLNKPGVEFSLTYFDNPGINVPSTITTWVAMRAMPDFLSKLREAAKGYKGYCKATGRSCICDLWEEQKVQSGIVRDDDSRDDGDEGGGDGGNGEDEKESDDAQNTENSLTPENIQTLNTRLRIESGNPNYSGDITNQTLTSSNSEAERVSYFKYLHPYYYFS